MPFKQGEHVVVTKTDSLFHGMAGVVTVSEPDWQLVLFDLGDPRGQSADCWFRRTDIQSKKA
jgi:hypothetical protein